MTIALGGRPGVPLDAGMGLPGLDGRERRDHSHPAGSLARPQRWSRFRVSLSRFRAVESAPDRHDTWPMTPVVAILWRGAAWETVAT